MTDTTTNNNDTTASRGHTNDPFTAPQEQSNVNNCGCFGIFMVPLAAIGGFFDQILQKGSKKTTS
ncbi:hypothetical protein BCR42DRAFT_411197 [Absidia repens]|uniref:Transmembrane protein n=1 Tax=Absidia repens TaxID=90262 RepID=A0A1X2ILF0_9FUNG|nr:hypothetical protein BCR42DRAFT_411197 [Absidia repens]